MCLSQTCPEKAVSSAMHGSTVETYCREPLRKTSDFGSVIMRIIQEDGSGRVVLTVIFCPFLGVSNAPDNLAARSDTNLTSRITHVPSPIHHELLDT